MLRECNLPLHLLLLVKFTCFSCWSCWSLCFHLYKTISILGLLLFEEYNSGIIVLDLSYMVLSFHCCSVQDCYRGCCFWFLITITESFRLSFVMFFDVDDDPLNADMFSFCVCCVHGLIMSWSFSWIAVVWSYSADFWYEDVVYKFISIHWSIRNISLGI